MKKFFSQFSQTTTTSIISLLWTLGAIIMIFYILSGHAKSSETIQTQIIQTVFGIIMFMCGYYYNKKENKKEGGID